MKFFNLSLSVVLIGLLLPSCGDDPKGETVKQDKDSTVAKPAYFWNLESFSDKKGALGVFDVPEMLCLSIFDSASVNVIADHYTRNYSILSSERDSIGIKSNGSVGVINYNNDPRNLKFECILLIDQMPSINPRVSRIVALEATRGLVYNYYGPYSNLYFAYKDIREYCKQNKLVQSGPVREFYLNDASKEPDPAKWLTRIILPVIAAK